MQHVNSAKYTVVEHIVKEYPNDKYKVTVFNNPLIIPKPKKGRTVNRSSEKPSDDAITESLRRTRATIFDYALSNDFEYFVTFTFNPKKVDRYSIEATFNTMKYWLNRQKKHSPDFAYVIVPEFHKDGAIHFHALIRDYNAELKSTNVFQNGKRVYNLTGFTSGFTNAQKMDDNQEKTAGYITKYITKDTINRFNKRRYWASKNLQKPVKYYESLEALNIRQYIIDDNISYYSDDHNVAVYQFKRDSTVDFVYDLLADKYFENRSVDPPVVRYRQLALSSIFRQTLSYS